MRWWCGKCNLWNVMCTTDKHKAKMPLVNRWKLLPTGGGFLEWLLGCMFLSFLLTAKPFLSCLVFHASLIGSPLIHSKCRSMPP